MQRRRHSICLAAAEDHTQKKTTRYQEQDPEEVAAYQEQIKEIPPEKVAYVDECGIDTYLYREYGYAPRGQKVYSTESAAANINAAALLPPKWRAGFLRRFSIAALWIAHFLNFG